MRAAKVSRRHAKWVIDEPALGEALFLQRSR
jgi:hypothetical protein